MFRTFTLKTKPTARFASSLWILLTGFGCSPQMTGSLTPNGFNHSTYAYDVESQPKTSTLLNSDWVLDSAYESRGDLRPKETSSYKTTLSFDLNGDGVFEAKEGAFVYDLRYVHRVHSGVIWLRTVPVSMTLRDKELRVLMQDYVDGIAGSGMSSWRWAMRPRSLKSATPLTWFAKALEHSEAPNPSQQTSV
jgi:hypothetical protein